jgi:peptidoglycan lytic transglycosylase
MRCFACVASLLVAFGLVLSGCSSKSGDPFAGTGSPRYPGNGPLPKGGGHYLVGEPYQVAGRWFRPVEERDYDKVGMASWYGPQFHRRQTSNGEWFDMNYLSAAHATLPLPSYVKVTNLENGRELVVRVNDRGPFVGTRIIDLSKRAAEVLDVQQRGTAKVRVQYLGPAPLNDKGTDLAAMNRQLDQGAPVRQIARKSEEAPPPQMALAEEIDQPSENASAVAPEYFVQVGAFADPDNAEHTRDELSDVGPIEVQSLSGSAGTLYRVRVGPLNSESEARDALSRVVDAGHADARLVMARNTL